MSENENDFLSLEVFFSTHWPVIVILAVSVLVAYISVAFLGQNNPIELQIEKVLELETGIRVDLTP